MTMAVVVVLAELRGRRYHRPAADAAAIENAIKRAHARLDLNVYKSSRINVSGPSDNCNKNLRRRWGCRHRPQLTVNRTVDEMPR